MIDGKYLNWKPQQLLLEVKSSVPYKFSIDTINERTHYQLPVYRMAFTTEKVADVKMEFSCTPIGNNRF